MFWSSPSSSNGKEFACNEGDLGLEDLLEKGMETHSSIFVWRIPWTEKPGGLQSIESKESDMAERLTLLLLLFYVSSNFATVFFYIL